MINASIDFTLNSEDEVEPFHGDTVFDLITTHTPISPVKQFRSLQITASVLFVYFFIKAYVVGTHLNFIDLLMQFK